MKRRLRTSSAWSSKREFWSTNRWQTKRAGLSSALQHCHYHRAQACRIGWAGCRRMHRRAPARRNTMHGWLSEPRKRRGRRPSSSSQSSRHRASPHWRLWRLAAFKCMGDSRCHWIWRGAREFRARQHCIRINLECDGNQRQGENDGHGSHGRIFARD
jgi:hypothetical protein